MTTPDTVAVYAPDGAIGPEPVSLAPSPAVLAGARIGILDNTKPNADVLLSRMAARLAERTGASVTLVETKNAALPAPDDVMARLCEEVELVLTGSAD